MACGSATVANDALLVQLVLGCAIEEVVRLVPCVRGVVNKMQVAREL